MIRHTQTQTQHTHTYINLNECLLHTCTTVMYVYFRMRSINIEKRRITIEH